MLFSLLSLSALFDFKKSNMAHQKSTALNMTPWCPPDLNLEWHSAAFDEVICVTDVALRGRDILVYYKWMDLTPPAIEMRHYVKLPYRSGPWYDFAYWVKYVLCQVPSSRSLSSTIKMLKTCKEIMDTLDDCVLCLDPLPKPERNVPVRPTATIKPVPPLPPPRIPDADSDCWSTTSLAESVVDMSSGDDWGFAS